MSTYQRTYLAAIEDGCSEDEARRLAQMAQMNDDDYLVDQFQFDIVVPDGEIVLIAGDEV